MFDKRWIFIYKTLRNKMNKQTYMKERRTIEMKRGEDGIYRMIPEEQSIIGYGSDLRLRTENVKGGLVNLTC